MRRAILCVAVLCATAWADPAIPASEIRAARDAVAARPEFRYGAEKPKSFVEEFFDRVGDWLRDVKEHHPWAFLVSYALLAALALILVVHIVWTLKMARRAEFETSSEGDLDAAMRHGDAAPFRARAVEHAAAGRFDEAVRDLYAALLCTLDRRGIIRYASYKALLDYRIEATRDAAAARALALCAATYHPGSFGRRPPDRAHFDELLAAVDSLAGPAA